MDTTIIARHPNRPPSGRTSTLRPILMARSYPGGEPCSRWPGRRLPAGRAGQPLTMIGFLLFMLVIGIVAGFLARLLVPGRDPMGFWATVLLGIIGSVIGAVIALLIYRAMTRSRRGAMHR